MKHKYIEHRTYSGPDCAICGRPRSEHDEEELLGSSAVLTFCPDDARQIEDSPEELEVFRRIAIAALSELVEKEEGKA